LGYILRVEDSRFSNRYREGVELSVNYGKITEAKDVRSYTKIAVDNRYFLVVKKLFGIAKWGIKDAVISYDLLYGYPTYIKLKNGLTISASLYNQ